MISISDYAKSHSVVNENPSTEALLHRQGIIVNQSKYKTNIESIRVKHRKSESIRVPAFLSKFTKGVIDYGDG